MTNFGPDHQRTQHTCCTLAEALAAAGQTNQARGLLAANIGVIESEAQADPTLASAQERLRCLVEPSVRLESPASEGQPPN